MTYRKPSKIIVPLEQAKLWTDTDYLIQVKYDGEFQTRSMCVKGTSAVVAGEFVTAKSGGFLPVTHRNLLAKNPGGFFVPFDLLELGGTDFTKEKTRFRWNALLQYLAGCNVHHFVDTIPNGKFIEGGFIHGCEGFVAKRWDAPYGEMLCVKQLQTYNCVVTKIGGTQAVEISEAFSNTPRGRVMLSGGKVEKVRVGSVLKVEAMGLTDAGKFREPRVCRDSETSWLIAY